MEVLVTGGDTQLGRAVAGGFRDAGHRVTLGGARANELKVATKELDAEAIVCDNTDPASLTEARGLFPHHLDTVVNVPAPRWEAGDPRIYSLAELAAAWRSALDTTVLSAVLTVQTVGDHLRSGGSIVSVVPENPRDGSADAAVKAALSDWTAGQAGVFGTRGITVNVVASGSGSSPGYDGLTWGDRPLVGDTPPTAAAEVTRLALFLTTPAARHITGQTLHVSHGALTRFD
jgi:NAD(P)-dependent dehydrogenase (short-subunit alcohol dehydrogenase family)